MVLYPRLAKSISVDSDPTGLEGRCLLAAIWAYARFAAKHFLSKFKRLELEGPLHLGRGGRADTVGHGDDQDVQQEDLRPPSHAGITSSTVTTRTLRSHVY